MKASNLTTDKLSFLFKGPPGFSKTCSCASFAVAGPIYIAYFDKQKPVELDYYFRHIVKRPELLDNIEYDVYGATNAHEYLNKLIDFTKDCRYTAVITDSLTSLTAAAVNWSMGFRNKNKSSKDKINNEAAQLIPDFDEYKIETSLVTQALDICKTLPSHIIWTAHPLAGIRVEGSGKSITVTKTNPIVSYGSKVASIIPGAFTEIYHFSKETSWTENGTQLKYIVETEAVGDDYAKTALGLKRFDITNRLFYEVWKEELSKMKEP